MASFDEHIKQAKRNLHFFEKINHEIDDCIDWQVTVCFYTALHLINAHLSTFNLQYRRHTDVKHALNPEVKVSPSRLPEDEYIAYVTLQMLSRRSRYLVNEKDNNENSSQAFFTYDKHLAKAIRHLDKLINYFVSRYSVDIKPVNVYCSEVKDKSSLQHIKLS